MIADARRLDHRNFSLTYTHLSNVSSRIDWQRALDPPEFFVHFQVNENGQISCLRRYFNSRKTIPCNIDADIALQPWPPKGPRFLIFILTKLLVYYPVPLLPGSDLTEMVCCDG